MLQKTRALRRASAAASARAAIHARRPMTILATTAATLVGITLSVGLASAPAVGATVSDAAAAVGATFVGAEPLTSIDQDAKETLAAAQGAVLAAETLGDEVTASGLDVGAVTAVDTAALEDGIDRLSDRGLMPVLLVGILSDEVQAATAQVASATTDLRQALTTAQEKHAAEEAARIAAEQAAAAQRAAEALAAANTVEGAKATARQLMASQYGWGEGEFSCLESLWNKESGWNYQAYNADGGATGIPQALPGSKMASAGADWQTSAATQIAWGLGYIASAYGSPCSAWSHSQAMNWY
ncbi:phospholipase [Microbacterium paraoxydans]|uniref:aggregation-promoting factor C-terminal-like domain-containing protein n=1 Tax=Microbacterium paraoxydans TaxID=199592 RepID=UPI001CFC13B1|nr:phospholipase [Microbacterium paraoxydans]